MKFQPSHPCGVRQSSGDLTVNHLAFSILCHIRQSYICTMGSVSTVHRFNPLPFQAVMYRIGLKQFGIFGSNPLPYGAVIYHFVASIVGRQFQPSAASRQSYTQHFPRHEETTISILCRFQQSCTCNLSTLRVATGCRYSFSGKELQEWTGNSPLCSF